MGARVWLVRHGCAALAFAVALIAFVGCLCPFVGFAGGIAVVLTVSGARPRRPLSRLTIALGAASVLAATLLLVAPPRDAARGSSPRVYTEDGAGLTLAADVVSGALYSWAERRDVTRLTTLRAIDGEYRIRAQNDFDGAADHVDGVSILIVDHPKGTEILPTPKGRLVAVTGASVALRAVDGAGLDVARALSAQDGVMAMGGSTTDSGEPVRTWTLELPRPSSRQGILVLRARSTTFAEDAFFRYMATMGQGIGTLMEHVVKADCGSTCAAEVMDEELERMGLFLSVRRGAELLHAVAPVGPAVVRSIALPIEIPAEGDTITIELTATPDFWDVDEVELGHEAQGEVDALVLEPRSAALVSGSGREDVLDRVSAFDRRRLSVEGRAHIDLVFDAPPATVGLERAAFVAVRAHYEVPIGGAPFLNPVTIAAHRLGLTSLPRFAATLRNR